MFLFTQPLSVVYGHGAAWEATTEHESTGLKSFDRGAALVELALSAHTVSRDASLEISDHHRGRRGSESEYGKDRGAVLVETAFILVLLMMLLVGTVSGALALGRDNSIQNAAREASRFAATLPDYDSDPNWLARVRDVARAAAVGDLESTVDGQYICVAVGDGTTWDQLTDGSGTPTGPDCFTDNRPVGEVRVQVVTQRNTPFNVILWSTDITLTAVAAARYER